MALFPPTPSDGELANVGNITYRYSTSVGAWNRVGTTVTPIFDGITVSISGNLAATGSGTQTFTGPIQASTITASGNITAGNLRGSVSSDTIQSLSGGNIDIADQAVFAGNVYVDDQLRVAANTTVTGNLLIFENASVVKALSANSVSTTGNITASGNVSGTYLLGNGAFLSGVITSVANINNGTSNVSIGTADGNVTVGVNGTDNIAVFSGSGLTLVGNVDAGNVRTDNYFYANGAPLALGSPSRTTASGFTGDISANATGNLNLEGYLGYILYKVQVDTANAWVKIYTSEDARTADSARSIGTDPLPSAGVVAEIIAATANTYAFAPAVVGYNDEDTPNTQIAIAVTNTGASTANIGVTLTLVKFEG